MSKIEKLTQIASEAAIAAQVQTEKVIEETLDKALDGAASKSGRAKQLVETYKAERNKIQGQFQRDREVRDNAIELARVSFSSKSEEHTKALKDLETKLNEDLGKEKIDLAAMADAAETVVLENAGKAVGKTVDWVKGRFNKFRSGMSQ
jgi:seryl-tRNA synthetase